MTVTLPALHTASILTSPPPFAQKFDTPAKNGEELVLRYPTKFDFLGKDSVQLFIDSVNKLPKTDIGKIEHILEERHSQFVKHDPENQWFIVSQDPAVRRNAPSADQDNNDAWMMVIPDRNNPIRQSEVIPIVGKHTGPDFIDENNLPPSATPSTGSAVNPLSIG